MNVKNLLLALALISAGSINALRADDIVADAAIPTEVTVSVSSDDTTAEISAQNFLRKYALRIAMKAGGRAGIATITKSAKKKAGANDEKKETISNWSDVAKSLLNCAADELTAKPSDDERAAQVAEWFVPLISEDIAKNNCPFKNQKDATQFAMHISRDAIIKKGGFLAKDNEIRKEIFENELVQLYLMSMERDGNFNPERAGSIFMGVKFERVLKLWLKNIEGKLPLSLQFINKPCRRACIAEIGAIALRTLVYNRLVAIADFAK